MTEVGRSETSPSLAVVHVIDDDPSVREGLRSLFRSVGLDVVTYVSPSEFLESAHADVPSCLVLDVRLPEASGLDLQADLVKANINIPIIFMTGHGDIPMSVRAMKAGAIEFLTKPFREEDMLSAVRLGLLRDRQRRDAEKGRDQLRQKFEFLSQREREVMVLAAAGQMNKQIAAELGIAEITAKIHRASVMKKMNARTLADLVSMAVALGLRS